MKYPDTQFLRALGILLIVNSHLDSYYPVKQIATGGAIGNSIFFFLSGFGIYLSQQNRNKSFKEFMADRIIRIYPTMWLVLVLLTLPLMISSGRLTAETVTTYVGYFFNPEFWFLQALLVYYLLSFWVIKYDQQRVGSKSPLILLGFMSIVYFASYFTWVDLSVWSVEKTPFDRIHYFMVFVFGLYVASQSRLVTYTGLNNFIILFFIIILVYVHKYLMTNGLLSEFQFLQQAAMYPLVYYLLKVCRSPSILNKLTPTGKITQVIKFLSDHTLEIYMIHETLNRPLLKLELAFPLNIIVFVTLTFIFAAIINNFAGALQQKINGPTSSCTLTN